jgi:hypothetical protein
MLIRFKLAQTVPVKTSIQPGFSLQDRNQTATTTACHKNVTICKTEMQKRDHNIKKSSRIFLQTRIWAKNVSPNFSDPTYLIHFLVLVTPEAEGLDRERDGLSRPLEGVQTCQVPKLNPVTNTVTPNLILNN